MYIRTGTAEVISKAYPGSVHDIQIMREHADELSEILGDKTMWGTSETLAAGETFMGWSSAIKPTRSSGEDAFLSSVSSEG